MTIFTDGIAALFESDLAADATYTPSGGGAAVSLRAILSRGPVEDAALGRAGFRLGAANQARAVTAEIRAGDVAEPDAGATLTVEGRAYPVKAFELVDHRLTWRLVLGQPA